MSFYLLINSCFLFSISGNNNETRDQTFSSLNSNKDNEVLEKSKQTQNRVNNWATTQSMSTSTNTKTIIDLNNISISKPVNNKKEEMVQKFCPQLEIIPKPEPLSDVEEETDTSSETEEFNRSNKKPFLLVSEYLSQTKAFSQYMTNNNENNVCNNSTFEKSSTIDKFIDIDLNKESDQDSNNESVNNIESIFNNQIIDLTPKTSAKKKSNAKSKPKSKQSKCKLFSNLNSILKEF